MSRIEFDHPEKPQLNFKQKLAVRLDETISDVIHVSKLVAPIHGEDDPFRAPEPEDPARVELHRRFDRFGTVRKAIAHIVNAEGEVIGREVFNSEKELRQAWSNLQFRPA